jgi:sRNA-binding protein
MTDQEAEKLPLLTGLTSTGAGDEAQVTRLPPLSSENSQSKVENPPTPAATIEGLVARWPQAFAVEPAARRPLKVGIFADLEQVLGDAVSSEDLSAALGAYVNCPQYWKKCTSGAPRFNLKGEADGEVTAFQADYAYHQIHGIPWQWHRE